MQIPLCVHAVLKAHNTHRENRMIAARAPGIGHAFVGAALVYLSALGCGGGPTAAMTRSQATDPPGARGASMELIQGWPFDAPTFAIYADVRGLMRTQVAKELLRRQWRPTLPLSPTQRECADGFFFSVSEFAIGGDPRGFVTLARVFTERFSPS